MHENLQPKDHCKQRISLFYIYCMIYSPPQFTAVPFISNKDAEFVQFFILSEFGVFVWDGADLKHLNLISKLEAISLFEEISKKTADLFFVISYWLIANYLGFWLVEPSKKWKRRNYDRFEGINSILKHFFFFLIYAAEV